MNERLQELLDNIQRAAGQVGSAASDALDCAGRKATQLLSVGKLNVQLAELRSEMDGMLQEVGDMIYATHTGTPTDSEVLLEKLRGIDGVQEQISRISFQIEQLRAQQAADTVCPNCGAAVRANDLFCRECGGKL